MSDCLSNLHRCNASCCRLLGFNIPGFLSESQKDYYIKHGCKIVRLSRELHRVLVPIDCPQLDPETNLCRLHNTDQKPLLCQTLNENTAKNGKFIITEGCIYGEDENSRTM